MREQFNFSQAIPTLAKQTSLRVRGRGKQVAAVPAEIMVDRIVEGMIPTEPTILIGRY